MKRHSEDNYGGGKRSRHDSGKAEIRILIQSKNAGGVIGRGGENIKRLRSQYNASLTVPDSNSPERILTCIADPANAIDCIREILPKLDESKSPEDEMDLRILVHQSHAGAVIGRAGFKIKELREQTNTNLKVYSQCCPLSTDRVLQVNGQLAKILDAVQAVLDLISDLPIKGTNKPYDTINYDPSFVYDYGGFPPDKGWRPGPGGGGGPAPPPPPPARNSWSGPSGRYGGGGPRGPPNRDYPPAMDYPSQRGGPRQSNLGGPPPPPPPPMGFGGGAGPMQTTQVTIPSELGGTIIGKGGERINRIREDSGAHIIVDPPSSASDERVITISGTQNQIQMAQYLLQQCVRSSVAGRKYIQQQQSR